MTEATEVRTELERLRNQGYDQYIDSYTDSVEGAMERVVEQGTFTPDCSITAGLNLTLNERITGRREQDVTAVFLTGLMLGAALERDIEQEWRDGGVVLP